jgi:aldehyde dehydrogenase family protein
MYERGVLYRFTPLAWQAAIAGWKQLGPPDVLDAVFGFGETGSALVDVVDYVMFTGSVNTGRRFAAAAAERLIPCSLQRVGKDDDDRLRRRRYRPSRRRRGMERIHLRRPSLHLGGARVRRRAGLRRVRQQIGGQDIGVRGWTPSMTILTTSER